MKNVLITGGSRGIGRACVEKFAREGYTVSFIYNNSDGAATELSTLTGAHPIKADISNPGEAKRAVSDALSAMGGVDVLINNAGISLIKLFTDTTDEDYFNVINTNFGGAFFVTREAVKPMISSHYGRIINIGSMWGKTGASCEVAYSASKSALEGFTKALAKELGPSGINVNAIAPGLIDTEMNASLTDDVIASIIEETPLMRIGTPQDVASLAYFLASEESSFITGEIISINGGYLI